MQASFLNQEFTPLTKSLHYVIKSDYNWYITFMLTWIVILL